MALLTDLELYYKLESDATDSSGNGNNGTVDGATFVSSVIGNGADFDGSNDKIDVPYPFLLSGDFTISFWVNLDVTSGTKEIFYTNQPSTSPHFRIYTVNGVAAISSHDGSYSGFKSTGNTLSVNTDYFITAVRTGTSTEFYIDGTSVSTLATQSGTLSQTNDWLIGRGFNANWVDGTIDEVGVWSRALSSTEVSDLYNSGAGLTYPFGETVATTNNKSLFIGGNL